METFKEMNIAELQETDGGSIELVVLGGFCLACFCMGVYNGYKGNA